MSKHDSVFHSCFQLNNVTWVYHTLFIHSPNGQLGCFQFLASMNNATIKIHVINLFLCGISSTLNLIQCIFYLRHLSFQSLKFLFRSFFKSSLFLLDIFDHSSSFLNIWDIIIISVNHLCHFLVGFSWLHFLLIMGCISCLCACLRVFLDARHSKFFLVGSWIFFIPVNIPELCCWIELCYLEGVWSFWVLLFSLVRPVRISN